MLSMSLARSAFLSTSRYRGETPFGSIVLIEAASPSPHATAACANGATDWQ
jgi:hypothetical protein